MLLIMISDQYPYYYKVLEIYIGYFDSLDIMILSFIYIYIYMGMFFVATTKEMFPLLLVFPEFVVLCS